MTRTLTAMAAACLLTLGACATPSSTVAAGDDADSSSETSKSPSPKKVTVAQKQAVRAAQQYVDLQGFSKAGLYKQLTSSAGSGFKKADAKYALAHIKVNYNTEAVQAAKSYLDLTAFSADGLYRQLTSSAGSGFTPKQARYAVKKVGL